MRIGINVMELFRFARTRKLIEEHDEAIADLDEKHLMVHMCMLTEQVCKRRGIDAVSFSEEMHKSILEVNKVCGKY